MLTLLDSELRLGKLDCFSSNLIKLATVFECLLK